MKTFEEQISNKCIHFNGLMNTRCKKGIDYADVRFDRPYKVPCLNQGGVCEHCQFPTLEEVKKQNAEMEEWGTKTLIAYAIVKKHVHQSGEKSGKINCACGGELKFVVSSVNGHICAKCSLCGISFNE